MQSHLVSMDHVQIAAPPGCDEAARRFYGGVLGLEEIPLPPVLRGRASCWFQCGSQEIHIGIEEDFRPARKAHPAFVVTDIAALMQSLQARGLETLEDFSLTDRRRFFVFDPWGNRLEFLQRHAV